MLLGGFVTNCYLVLLSDYQFLGFTGVVASSIGIYAGFLILNWPYLVENYRDMLKPWIVGWLSALATFMLNGTSLKYVLFHAMSMLLGVFLGIGLCPPYPHTDREKWMSRGFRIYALVAVLAPILVITHPLL